MPNHFVELGNTLHSQSKKHVKANKQTAIEFGEVTGSLGIKPDVSPGPIPKGSYSICRHISGEEMTKITHMGDEIVIKYPELKPGDRVLIANYGTECTVIDVIL